MQKISPNIVIYQIELKQALFHTKINTISQQQHFYYCSKIRNITKNSETETLTFSFLNLPRMLPSSLSTRSRSCSLFWQLRMSLMNMERPLMPESAMAGQIQLERERGGNLRTEPSLLSPPPPPIYPRPNVRAEIEG